MLRVMLVDDEPLALEGMRLLIDWNREGFEVCGSFPGGREALDALQSLRPHLIMTDIRMQGMDGLGLMAAARERGYDGAFVVVSGYGDFEYAKRAMRLGVAGYLLKPLDREEAAQVLDAVRKKLIGRELSQNLPMAAYQQAVSAALMGQAAKHPLPKGGWQLFTWGAPLPYDASAELLKQFALPGIQASTHIADGREWLVLQGESALANAPVEELRRALELLRRELIASPVAEEAQDLARLRLDLCARLNDCEEELALRARELADAAALLQHEKFRRLADDLTVFCLSKGGGAAARARELFGALCAEHLAQDPKKLNSLYSAPPGDLKALGELVMALLTPEPQRLSDQVRGYLEGNYAKPLSLESVAGALGYNAPYLGRVFREETGMGLRDYLNDLRIEKAAQMLLGSSLTVRQAADAVGYSEYKLFRAHFKRRYHKTPMEYRRRLSP